MKNKNTPLTKNEGGKENGGPGAWLLVLAIIGLAMLGEGLSNLIVTL